MANFGHKTIQHSLCAVEEKQASDCIDSYIKQTSCRFLKCLSFREGVGESASPNG